MTDTSDDMALAGKRELWPRGKIYRVEWLSRPIAEVRRFPDGEILQPAKRYRLEEVGTWLNLSDSLREKEPSGTPS